MIALADQTAGPNWLTFLREHWLIFATTKIEIFWFHWIFFICCIQMQKNILKKTMTMLQWIFQIIV